MNLIGWLCDDVIITQGNWVDNERSGEGEFHYNTGEVYSGHWADDKQSELCEARHFNICR